MLHRRPVQSWRTHNSSMLRCVTTTLRLQVRLSIQPQPRRRRRSVQTSTEIHAPTDLPQTSAPTSGSRSLVPTRCSSVSYAATGPTWSGRGHRARAIPTAPSDPPGMREPRRGAELPLLTPCSHEHARTSHALPRVTATGGRDPPGRFSKVQITRSSAESEAPCGASGGRVDPIGSVPADANCRCAGRSREPVR